MVNLFLFIVEKKLVTNHKILSRIKQATGAQYVLRCISHFSFILTGQDNKNLSSCIVHLREFKMNELYIKFSHAKQLLQDFTENIS